MSEDTGINGGDPLGLGLDLSQVDTSRPVLPEALYVLNIKDVKVQPSKKDADKKNLVVTFETTAEAMDVTGTKQINAGYIVTKYYPLQQSDNDKAPDFKRDLAFLQDAVEGTKQGERPPFNPFNYVGQRVMAKLKVRADDGEFGAQNDIAKLETLTA